MKLSLICKANYATMLQQMNCINGSCVAFCMLFNGINCGIILLTTLQTMKVYGIIIFTLMPSNSEAKRKILQASGTFNPRAAQVRHPLFQQSAFFDSEDLLQLKYETLRALEVENYPLAKAARDFGLSRPTIYQAQSQFQEEGLEGLLPRKRGPKAAHKLTDEVLQYFQEQVTAQPDLKVDKLVQRVRQRFGVKLHPRTIQKALNDRAKRGRPI